MKRTPIFALSVLALLAAACGERVTVETGEVGKVLGTSGLEKKTYQPSSFRLDICGFGACPKLVRLQVNKSTTVLSIDTLYLPKSNVDIRNVQVGIVFQVKEDEESVAKIYDEVKPESAAPYVMLISADKVYETYLARKAPDAIVTELRKHSVEEVLTNVPEIADATKIAIAEMLGDAPIEVTELGFPNGIGEVPKEVIQAKRRLFAVDEEKARSVRALAAELEVEAQRQRVQKVRAENDVINAQIAGVPYDVYVRLKNEERFADAADAMAEAVADGSNDVIIQAPAPQPPKAEEEQK
jgi:hypothetical protein